MAGMTAEEVYVLLGDEIVLLTEEVKQMGNWEPIEHKGTVQTAEDLPTDAKKGWMYNIANDSIYGAAGMNVVMTSEGWDPMGPIINMGMYLTKEEGNKTFQPKGNYLSGTDSDLKESGKAADAKVTGEKIAKNSSDITKKLDKNQGVENSGKIAGINESGDIVPMFPAGVEYNSETNCLEFGSDQKMELNQGIGLDSTLTKTGSAADAGAVGEITNSLKEDISTKITKFYASSRGKTHLADSDNGKIQDMMVYGKSEQKQYSGKNLIPPITYSGNVSDLQVDAKEGLVRLKGTPNAEVNYPILGEWNVTSPTLFTLHAGDYTVSGCGDTNNSRLNLVYLNDGQLASFEGNRTFTLDKDTNFVAVFVFADANKYVDITFTPMIEKGSTATAFEPYTGGQPSPSPDYPQEIKSVVNPTVKVCGKNLLNPTLFKDYSLTKNGVTCKSVTDETGSYFLLDGTADSEIDFWLQTNTVFAYDGSADKLTISVRETCPDSYYLCVGTVERDFRNTKAVTTSLKAFSFYIHVLKGAVINNYRIYVQVEVGDIATDYEPYTEQTVALPYTLNAIPVSSGGNVTINGQQYIADYVDVERGKLVRMVGEFDTKDLTVFGRSETDGVYRGYFSDSMLRKFVAGNSFRTKLFDGKSTPNATRQYSVYMDKNNEGQWMNFICDSTYRETADLKSFIQNTGTVYGIFETSEEIDLTTEEIAAFKALVTYYPTTNISINSEQLDGYTVFNYPISMENGWNYVKQQIGDTRNYIYDMDARTQDTDLQAAEAYVNSEYAVALTELEV